MKVIEDAFDFIVHDNPMSLLQYGPMQGDARLAELTLQRLSKVHHMNLEGQGLIISNGAGQLLGLVPITVCEPGDEVTWMIILSQVLLILYAIWGLRQSVSKLMNSV